MFTKQWHDTNLRTLRKSLGCMFHIISDMNYMKAYMDCVMVWTIWRPIRTVSWQNAWAFIYKYHVVQKSAQAHMFRLILWTANYCQNQGFEHFTSKMINVYNRVFEERKQNWEGILYRSPGPLGRYNPVADPRGSFLKPTMFDHVKSSPKGQEMAFQRL